MSEEEKTAKVLQLFKDGSKPAPRRRPSAAKVTQITVNGQVTGQVIGGDVNHYTVAKPPRPKVVVTPGDGVVTDEQKAKINEKRLEWIALHNNVNPQNLLTDASAWVKINARAGVTSYHFIPLERFDDVIAFIQRQMAMLRSKASAPGRDDTWRTKRIAAIKVRCKNQLGDPDAYKPYIKKNFRASSLADLATDELRRTYNYIMAKKAPTQ